MNYRLLLTVAAVVAAADALTKATAVAMSRWMPFRLGDGWSLQVVHNNGVIGGGGAHTAAPAVFVVIALAQLAAMLWLYRNAGRPQSVGVGLLTGAAAGNLGEHWLTGYVVDWICPAGLHMWFNLADVAVASGQVLLITLALYGRYASKLRPRPAVAR